MTNCFCTQPEPEKTSILLTPVDVKGFSDWLPQQSKPIQYWLTTSGFNPAPGAYSLMPNQEGKLTQVFVAVEDENDFWVFRQMAGVLPKGIYEIDRGFADNAIELACIAWGLGAYQFTNYKKMPELSAQLLLPENLDVNLLKHQINAMYLVRDLINTPAEDMGPAELAEAATLLAEEFGGKLQQIVGDKLLAKNFPMIYGVGKGSEHDSRLIDLTWGNKKHPKVTLVGKGVCFDTGGLNLKSHRGLATMKKDMAGAAHALGLAHMIMAAKLPIQLRVLIPAVENSVSANAFRPSDVLMSRKGISVEVTNTDAEGRLILADCLTAACEEKPNLLIDFATLTGAARVALGPHIVPVFSNQQNLIDKLISCSQKVSDPLWALPLYRPYFFYLESKIADIVNSSSSGYAGAITASLFLEQFVDKTIPWAHFDMFAWNNEERPGWPVGAEVQVLRAVFEYLVQEMK